MAGPGLPTNVDTTYANDGGDASVQAHQQHHDAIHGIVNYFDTTVGSGSANDSFVQMKSGLFVHRTIAQVRSDLGLDYWAEMSSLPRVNDYLHMAAPGTSNFPIAGGQWRGGPLILPLGFSWDRIRFAVNVAGTAACTCRVVLFNDNATPGRPGTVLLDSSNVAADATGDKTLTVSFTPTTRVVWAGIVTNGSPATSPQVQNRSTHFQDFVWPSEDSSGPGALYSGSGFTWGITMAGAAADNPTMTAQSINGQPRFAFRRSA